MLIEFGAKALKFSVQLRAYSLRIRRWDKHTSLEVAIRCLDARGTQSVLPHRKGPRRVAG